MTEPDGIVGSSSSEPAAASSAFAAVRKAHLELKSLTTEGKLSPEDIAARIRAFLATARQAGATLLDPGERRAAQGILDFWSGELAGNPKATEADFVPVILAPPDAAQPPSPPTQPDNAGPIAEAKTPKLDQRTLVRLAATARQWRDSGKRPGYLLTGDTIKEAEQYAGQDENLAEFVAASQKALERRRWISGVIYTVIVTLVAAGALIWYLGVVGRQISNLIVREATTGSDPAAALRLLDWFQPLHEPYDLSGTPKFADISAPKLRLYAPNFSGVAFSNVSFPEASLPVASFNGSDFSFDGSGNNDFHAAGLRQAQFRGARVANTSFAGADLYRASFDRALLCNVDFTGANLRNASFWAVTADDRTKTTLRQTAWWLALGWPWDEIEKLAPPHLRPSNFVEDEQLRNRLKTSTGFLDDIQKAIDDVQRGSAGTIERAVALNDLAWTDAVWGIDVHTPKQNQANGAAATDPCAASGLPANAGDAARQAVCIVAKLNGEGDNKGQYTALLSTLRDTQAYVFLQSNDVANALQTYGEMGRDNPKSLEDPETAFRYAIALYAGSSQDGDKAAAIARFTKAIQEGRYQPTHELQTLRDHIFPVKEFVEVLRDSSNKLWPPVKNLTPCPASKPAPAAK